MSGEFGALRIRGATKGDAKDERMRGTAKGIEVE